MLYLDKLRPLWYNALIISALVSILSSFGLLNFLNTITLNSFYSEVSYSNSAHKDVSVLALNQQWFEEVNFETRPLNRLELTKILDSIDFGNIERLTIDIDLSPSLMEGKRSYQNLLDDKLIKIASNSTTVILPIPYMPYSQTLLDKKVFWMKKMCEQGIKFGAATQNIASEFKKQKYIAYVNSVEYVRKARNPTIAEINYLLDSESYNYKCNFKHLLSYMQTDNEKTLRKFNDLIPLNFNKISNIEVINYTNNKHTFSSENLFIGVDLERFDQFNISGSNYPGVYLHALNYLSLKEPIKTLPIVSYIFDLLFTFIFLFSINFLQKRIEKDKFLAIPIDKLILFSVGTIFIISITYLMPFLYSYGIWENLFVVVALSIITELIKDNYFFKLNKNYLVIGAFLYLVFEVVNLSKLL